jgi:hypothetical protein
VPPRLFLHEFLKPREEIKESIQARRVFEYQCSPNIYTWPFTPTSIAHPLFISWWQEFHDHIFNEPVHSFCIELMPDFQPTSEVMHLFASFPSMSFDHNSLLLFAEHSACPSSQDILLQCRWPNFCFGLQFYNPGSADVQICYIRPKPYQFNF